MVNSTSTLSYQSLHPLSPFAPQCALFYSNANGWFWNWLTAAKNNSLQAWNTGFRFSRRYSILTAQLTILTLDILFLIGKADEKIPKEFDELILTLLSASGLLASHYTVDLIWKAMQDVKYSYRANNLLTGSLASLTALQNTTNLGLVIAGFTAAIEGVTGKDTTQTALYQEMIPIGEASLIVGLILLFINIYLNHVTLKKCEVTLSNEEIREIFDSLRSSLKGESVETIQEALSPSERESLQNFSAALRYCMDKDTFWHLLDEIKRMTPYEQEKLEKLLRTIQSNIQTQQKITYGGQLLLVITGYILQGIEKVYTPNSLTSAIINCTVIAGYTVKYGVEKMMEIWQRKNISKTIDDADVVS